MFDFPSSPALDQTYSAHGVTYRFNGYGWVAVGSGATTISIGDAPPSSPLDSTLWYETDTGILWVRLNDGNSTQWTSIAVPPGPTMGFLPLAGGTLTGQLVLASTTATLIQPSSGWAVLSLSATAGNRNVIYGYRGANLRWELDLGNDIAESGANTGGNLGISRFADNGNYIDTPLQITRSNGFITFSSAGSFGMNIPSDSITGNVFAIGNFSGGGLCSNVYYHSGGGWKYINNGVGCIIASSGAGGWDFYGVASGTSGNAATIIKNVAFGFWNGPIYFGPWACSINIGFNGGGNQYGIGLRCANDSTQAISFANAANTQVGSINTTATATSFNTSSDGQFKEDLQDFDAGQIIDNIKVYDFAWKVSGERAHGVVAQEAIEIYPEAVTHVDDEQMEWWGIDYSKYVPILLQELKALRQRVAVLEAR